LASSGDVSLLAPVSEVLAAVRRAKTVAKLSQRSAVEELIVEGPADALAAIEACRADLAEAGGITTFTLSQGPALSTTVRLTPSTDSTVAH
jgi:valyl-tRNA synthetase